MTMGITYMKQLQGGAPCNVLSMLQKLGRKTAFIGKVGKEFFWRISKETIEDWN